MSYMVYKSWKQANEYNKEYQAGSNEDYIEDKIFTNIKSCFNGIYQVAKFHRELRFDLKGNWKLLRAHDYTAVIDNINVWLQKADDRFDGETWTEKIQAPKTTGKLITGEENLQKYYEILTDEIGLIEHDDGVRFILATEVEVEIDDEDYDRIYFDTPNHDYDCYKQGIKRTFTEALIKAGVTNFKINTRFGEVKFYE